MQYYISSAGLDSNNGTATGTSWQTLTKVNATTFAAGDTISFNGGDTFSGTLTIAQAGATNNPILVNSYGTGQAIISGGTAPAIQVTNKSWIKVDNIKAISTAPNSSGTGGNQSGTITLSATTTASTRYPGITVQNCTIQGGLYGIWVTFPTTATDGFDNINLNGNVISASGNFGILVWHNQAGTRRTNNTNATISRNVVSGITGSTLYQGSGIVVGGCTVGLLEDNSITNCGFNTGSGSAGSGGIFPIWSDSIVIHRSMVSFIKAPNVDVDGCGFDIDLACINCMIDNCVAHDNDGSGYLIFAGSGSNNTIRNCQSINNCRKIFTTQDIRIDGGTSNYIYNNTIIQTDRSGATGIGGTTIASAFIFNNMVQLAGAPCIAGVTGTVINGNWYRSAGGFVASWNGTPYTSFTAFQVASSQEVNGTIKNSTNPLLALPTKVPTIGNTPDLLNINNFRPTINSPLFGAGLNLHTLYGITLPITDAAGKTLPSKSSIGAFSTLGASSNSNYDLTILNQVPLIYSPLSDLPGTTNATNLGGLSLGVIPYGVAILNQAGVNGTLAISGGISIPFAPSSYSSLSVECWINYPVIPSSGYFSYSAGDNAECFDIQFTAGGRLTFAAFNGSLLQASTPALTSNTWHHIVFSWSGGSNFKVYLDGTDQTQSLTTGMSQFPNAGTNPGLPFAVDGASKLLERIAVYSYGLSASQVAENYLAGTTTITDNLAGSSATKIILSTGVSS